MPAIDVLGLDARRTLLEVLACVVSADGEVTDEERAAFRGAAIALGEPDAVLDDAADLDLAPLSLGAREAMLVYCAAQWMALADAVQLKDESRLLARLRARLRIDGDTAHFLAGHARWVRTSTELPWHRELDLLITEGARRITKLEARANAA